MADTDFNIELPDAQATDVVPVTPESFDFEAYTDYESALLERCKAFWSADSGVLVHRRMRVAEVFSYGCADMRSSLELQLGALQKSMSYKADVPNFLEPWYGIGVVANAFGLGYEWHDSQAPATRPAFESVSESMRYPVVPVVKTDIGRHVLEMIDYFIDKTGGRLPISLTDTQSPLNIACNVIKMDRFFIEMITNAQEVREFLNMLADMLVDFTREQVGHLGETLVWPGHGFASSRCFDGLGMSDDNVLMISPNHYRDCVAPSFERAGKPFGGPVFHSCGDWSQRTESVKEIRGLRMVDGAFAPATDPTPNRPEPFVETFADTGIVVNARIVGDPDTVAEYVERLWKPGMKLIVVTYCKTPEEQSEVYGRVHEICAE